MARGQPRVEARAGPSGCQPISCLLWCPREYPKFRKRHVTPKMRPETLRWSFGKAAGDAGFVRCCSWSQRESWQQEVPSGWGGLTPCLFPPQRWSGPEKLLALDELIDRCEPPQIKHMMQVIEPQFQRDFISLLPKEVSDLLWLWAQSAWQRVGEDGHSRTPGSTEEALRHPPARRTLQALLTDSCAFVLPQAARPAGGAAPLALSGRERPGQATAWVCRAGLLPCSD